MSCRIEKTTFPGGYSPYETRGDCHFEEAVAANAVRFVNSQLRHIKGTEAGKPLKLELWQEDIIGTLFGWRRPDKTRRYRRAYIEIPRKAGKSTLASAIALILLYLDNEPGAEVYSCAGDRDQAAIVFEMAKANVQQNSMLDKRSKIYMRSIVNHDTKTGFPCGAYKVLSADAGTKHGYSPSGVIFDELHVQPNGDLWEAMVTGRGARRQPLVVAITTAGHDKQSVCWQQHDLACQVRDGLPNESFLPVIYAAEEKDDWTAESTWRKAQPNLGISVPASFYKDECQEAQQNPSYENSFKRLYLNIWTEQDVRWLPMDKWRACAGVLPDLAGRDCWAGLDLSTTTDITALVLAFPNDRQGCDLLCRFWVPLENARKKARKDHVDYLLWEKQKFVTFTDGDVVDYDIVRRDINELAKQYNIRELAIDRWNATQLTTQLMGDGFTIEPHGQGYASMSGPAKEFEKMVIGGSLGHGDNPVLTWMAGNVAAEIDAAGNIKPSKAKSHERIDGIVAAVMAVGRASMNGGQGPSFYETNPLEMF